jgi:hypothetical protein
VAGPGFVSLTIFSRTVADRTPDSAPREKWILFAVLMIFALSLGCLGGVVIGGFIVKATVDDDSDNDTFSEGPGSQPNQIVTRDELVKCISTQTPDGDSCLSESTSPQGKPSSGCCKTSTQRVPFRTRGKCNVIPSELCNMPHQWRWLDDSR